MKYLLDTDTCVFLMSGREPQVHQRMQSIPALDIVISTVTKAEMYSGAARSQQPTQSRERQYNFFSRYNSLPFDDAAADEYGRIDGILKNAGMSIGPLDTQIAAIALAYDLALVTHNSRHFSRVPDLSIEDWTVS